jgi:hypothetical protein
MAKPKKTPEFSPELLDAFAADLKTPADLEVLFRQMKKALVERALGPSSPTTWAMPQVSRSRRASPQRAP